MRPYTTEELLEMMRQADRDHKGAAKRQEEYRRWQARGMAQRVGSPLAMLGGLMAGQHSMAGGMGRTDLRTVLVQSEREPPKVALLERVREWLVRFLRQDLTG